MKKKINVRLVFISLVAILATVIGITTIYYGLFQKQVRKDLAVSAKLLKDTHYFESASIDPETIDLSTDMDSKADVVDGIEKITGIRPAFEHAASMEILSFLKQQGKRGEILHGSVEDVARRINALKMAYAGIEKLKGMRLGVIGAPSDWLIASDTDGAAYQAKLGLTLVHIPISELIEEAKKGGYEPNQYTQLLLAQGYDKAEMEKSLNVYGALKRIIAKYDLRAVTVRCFDLLNTVFTTGCLGLAILNAEGIYAGCEGDIPAAVSMAILGAVSGQDVLTLTTVAV